MNEGMKLHADGVVLGDGILISGCSLLGDGILISG